MCLCITSTILCLQIVICLFVFQSLPQTTLQGGVKNGAGGGRGNVSGDHHDLLPEPSADHDNVSFNRVSLKKNKFILYTVNIFIKTFV